MAEYGLNIEPRSRADGCVAGEKARYIARQDRYMDRNDARHVESSNMPSWVPSYDHSSHAYWSGADEFERDNGVLFLDFTAMLPRELSHEQQLALVRQYVRYLTEVLEGKLPVTWAIHDKEDGNPHLHLMLSERAHDGHDRDRGLWFRRKATGKRKTLAEGGAPKARSLKGSHASDNKWLLVQRRVWGEMQNDALKASFSDARVDHRSLRARGIDRTPQMHLGSTISAYVRDGREDELSPESRSLVALNRSAQFEAEIAREELELAGAYGDLVEEQMQEAAEQYQRAGRRVVTSNMPVLQSIRTNQPNGTRHELQRPTQTSGYHSTFRSGYRSTSPVSRDRITLRRVPTPDGVRTLSGGTVASARRRESSELLQSDERHHLDQRRGAEADRLRRAEDADRAEAGRSRRVELSRSGVEESRIEYRVRQVPLEPAAVGGIRILSVPTKTRLSEVNVYEPRQGKFGTLYIRRPDDVYALIDTGSRIKVATVDADSARACVVLAAEKWGKFELRGDDDFKRLAVKQAVAMGVAASITNPELQQLIANELFGVNLAAPAAGEPKTTPRAGVRKPKPGV